MDLDRARLDAKKNALTGTYEQSPASDLPPDPRGVYPPETCLAEAVEVLTDCGSGLSVGGFLLFLVGALARIILARRVGGPLGGSL